MLLSHFYECRGCGGNTQNIPCRFQITDSYDPQDIKCEIQGGYDNEKELLCPLGHRQVLFICVKHETQAEATDPILEVPPL